MTLYSQPPSEITWRKALASQANGSCIEVVRLTDSSIVARDSKHGDNGPLLRFSLREWGALMSKIKTSHFDRQ
jgi:hypothetical protein